MEQVTLFQYIVQGGFAALFVWLLMDTRKEARTRDEESKKREERLMSVIEGFNKKFEEISLALARIGEKLDNMHNR